jgi:hypothetical protein
VVRGRWAADRHSVDTRHTCAAAGSLAHLLKLWAAHPGDSEVTEMKQAEHPLMFRRGRRV